MCGRYTVDLEPSEYAKRWDLKRGIDITHYHFNSAPSQSLPIITNDKPDTLQHGTWGLMPIWAKRVSTHVKPQINARAETVSTLPTFRHAFKNNRCLVPARSFFEWDRKGNLKIPYRILLQGEAPFSFAGIWETFEDTITFSVITTDANILVHRIHNRMPVILTKKEEKQWLEDTKPERLLKLLDSYPDAKMDMYEVSTAVNSVRNNSKDLLKQTKNTFI